MKNIKKFLTVAVAFLIMSIVISSNAKAGLLYNYSQLSLKDLEQMSKLIQNKIAESRKAGGDQIIPLKEALQAVYSRSNEDFLIEKIMPPLKAELDEHDAWESSLKALTKEAIGALKNPKAFKPVVQVTYHVFLENLISEMKPRVRENFEKGILEQIARAEIKVSKEAENERRLRVMKGTTSPSDIAEGVLKAAEEAAAKATKK